MIPDVVRVLLVLLDADPFEQFGPDVSEDAGFAERSSSPIDGRRACVKSFAKFVVHALGRNCGDDKRGRPGHGVLCALGRGSGLILEAGLQLRGAQQPAAGLPRTSAASRRRSAGSRISAFVAIRIDNLAGRKPRAPACSSGKSRRAKSSSSRMFGPLCTKKSRWPLPVDCSLREGRRQPSCRRP